MAWLSGYEYRKEIPVNHSDDAAKADYQVPLTVVKGVGTDSAATIYLGVNVVKISVSAANHTNYGLGYPDTYIFNIPAASSGLKVHKQHTQSECWRPLTEKESTDFFNGIECVRFDYTNNKAYVSVAFSNASDDIYIRITDADRNTITFTFDSIAEYYDNRAAVVTVTGDDWSDSRKTAFETACAECRERSIWFTGGVITASCTAPTWASIQDELDDGFVEVASHSQSHAHIPYGDYEDEIEGSKQDIKDNLNLPLIYKNGSSEYVPAFFEPYGESDATARAQLGTSKYLADRDTSADDDFTAWDAGNGLYGRAGYSIRMGSDGSEIEADLNADFDTVYAAGGIYHLMCHPANVDWSDGEYAQGHLAHIKEKLDVWYVGFGALYMYHYVQERSIISTSATVEGALNWPYDIRYTSDDGETLLGTNGGGWREEYDATDGTWWVKVDDCGDHPTDGLIYAYFGDLDAVDASSIANTFIVGDDMERGNDGDAIGGSWTVSAGSVQISTAQKWGGTRAAKWIGAATAPQAHISVAASANIAIRFRAYKEDLAAFNPRHGNGSKAFFVRGAVDEDIDYYDGASFQDTGSNCLADTWQLWELNDWDWINGHVDLWLDGVEIETDVPMFTSTGTVNILRIVGAGTADYDTWIDNFIVRNWTANEPTFGTPGDLEQYTCFVLAMAENIGLAEALGRRAYSKRLFAEVLGLTDSLMRRQHSLRASAEPIGITDTSMRRGWAIRMFAETVNILETELAVFRVYLIKLMAETISLADTSLRRMWSVRIAAETIATNDAKIMRAWAIRLMTETEGILETKLRRMLSIQTLAETVNVLESAIRCSRAIRLMAETLTILDSAVSKFLVYLIKMMAEVLILVDTSLRRMYSIRLKAETLAITESKVLRARSVRFITETDTIVENKLRRMSSIRQLSESIIVLESFIRRSLAVRFIAETVTILESALRKDTAIRIMVETITILSAGIRRMNSVRFVIETVNIGEGLLRRLCSIRNISETITILASFIRRALSVRFMTETITILDSLIRRARSVRIIAETVNILDSMLSLNWLVKIANEVINITDSMMGILWRIVRNALGVARLTAKRLGVARLGLTRLYKEIFK